eukprot:scaffold95866_cov54-Phaeocystis_antarctica.AAC.2
MEAKQEAAGIGQWQSRRLSVCCKSTDGAGGTSGCEMVRMKSALLVTWAVAAATSSPVLTVARANAPVASCTCSSSCRGKAGTASVTASALARAASATPPTTAAAAAVTPPTASPTASPAAPVRPSRSPAATLCFDPEQPISCVCRDCNDVTDAK